MLQAAKVLSFFSGMAEDSAQAILSTGAHLSELREARAEGLIPEQRPFTGDYEVPQEIFEAVTLGKHFEPVEEDVLASEDTHEVHHLQ